VRDVYAVNKEQLGYIASYMDQSVPNRILVTTCAELGGVDYNYNIVIEAYLVSSKLA
jgi:hypothetical protein